MDFSQFAPLFALRQQLLAGLGAPGPIRTPAATTLRNRVAQELRRTSDAIAAAKPEQATFVKNILHASNAPLPSVGSRTPPILAVKRKRAAPRPKKRSEIRHRSR